jgi:3-oxoacyl-[acyl-carrier-protein] synthase II
MTMGNGTGEAPRRVVVTGMGLVSPVGKDLESSWQNMLDGKSGGGPVTQCEVTDEWACRVACEVKGFDPLDHMDRRDAKRQDRVSQFGIAASGEALKSAGLNGLPDGMDPKRFGVIFGTGIGGIKTFEEQHKKMLAGGPKRVSPFFIPMFIPDITAGFISIRWNLQGPNYATVSACASSAHAIGDAMRHIRHGDADMMIAGGSEATITPMTFAGFSSLKAAS